MHVKQTTLQCLLQPDIELSFRCGFDRGRSFWPESANDPNDLESSSRLKACFAKMQACKSIYGGRHSEHQLILKHFDVVT